MLRRRDGRRARPLVPTATTGERSRDLRHTTTHMKTTIPIWMSRHNQHHPVGYGAFIDWAIGERVLVISRLGLMGGEIRSDVKAHEQAPEIEGAHGTGPWVREILMDDTGQLEAVSTARIVFPGCR